MTVGCIEKYMVMKRLLQANFMLLVLLWTTSCQQKSTFTKLQDGIIVAPQEGAARQIRLKVVTDDIIQVTATPADTFSTASSLMVVPVAQTVSWTTEDAADQVILKTRRVHARVSKKSGEVVFTDTLGNDLLKEQQGGGKFFTPVKVEQQQSYAIRQVFESPADEAFYGLGGHQNGQMNYKGQDVEMVQQNIVDVVPFLYSSKNYGILWDNYSISHFGDPRDYQPLNTLKLFNREGKAGGLSAAYYVADQVVKQQEEDKIDYEFLETPQVDSFPKDVAQRGKVVWEGAFASDVAGSHKFLVYASGYFKVWLDDALIIDKWRQGWNPWTTKFTVDLTPGAQHKLRVEWAPDGGAYIAVKHLDPYPVADQQKLTLSSEVGDEINYYFIRGNSADEVIHGYRTLTGKAPIAPQWAMGFWQSRERYRKQDELIGIVKEYRKRGIPLDNIVLDWQYWEDPKWGSHDFDLTRFPDPKGMLETLHKDLHAHFMISVWPKFNKGTAHYDELNNQGFLFTSNIKHKRKDWVGVGYESTFYDPFNPKAGALFWKQIDTKLNVLGVDAWWLDATEPDMHSNISIDARKENMTPTGMGPGARFFNAYSLMNSKSVYEGQRKSSPDKRVFILTRSAYAGQQRYGAATWSGDIVSRWSDFQDQIATGINFSLSGIPYWTMDIGGFAVEHRYEHATGETLEEWRELNTRWFQFGAFCPLFRSHGQFPYREIFNIAPENHDAYKSMVYYTKLRYRLMPYIYTLAGEAYFNDYTIMRGLVMDFPQDEAVKNIADQYMFGPSLLVNPVYQYKARSRDLYLPKGAGWYDFYTGKYYEGGQKLTAEAPVGRMPLYVKAGAILPVGPELQYTGEKPGAPITLYVYTGADGAFTLYEDEGVNYRYEQQQYSNIPFRYNESTHTLTIGARTGSFDGMVENRVFQIVWVKLDQPVGTATDVRSAQEIKYNGQAIEVKMP